MLSTEMMFFAIVLAGGMAILALRPLFQRQPDPDQDQTQAKLRGTTQQNRALETLRAEKMRALRAVRDLDFDYDLGKLVDDTYATQRVYLIRLYVAIVKRLDELEGEVNAQQARIEAAVAAFRQARQRSQE
jgi:hypothetical protein